MNAHTFYNLLEKRIKLYRLHNESIHKYPDEFIKRYNAGVVKIEHLANEVNLALEEMAKLEKEQMDIVTKEYGR
jgi:hypothetical protein